MNKSFIYCLLTVGLLSLSFVNLTEELPSGHALTKNMFKSTREIKSMVFNMKKIERIKGEFVEQESFVKLNRDPLKVYSKQLRPKEGLEVLYSEDSKTALINPNGFPWVNLNLDPMGSTMRKGQHHTILDAGYDLVVSILEFLFNKYGEEAIGMAHNKGLSTYNGAVCWIIEIKNPYYKYEKYTVKEGEQLNTIADKFRLSEYMIMENNKEIEHYDDLTAGQVISIPNDYSPRIVLYIEKERMIPLMMKIYDDKGLFEQYEYADITLNPELSPAEFTPDYEEYNF